MLLYHHCMELENVVFRDIRGDIEHSDFSIDSIEDFFKGAYLWLEKQVGFYPLFLAVGSLEEDIRMTGYQNQWRKLLSEGPDGKKYRKKGEFPNYVLFSFENVNGIFVDYDYWYLVLNAEYKNYQMTDYEKKLIFKPSWQASKWLRKAKKNPHSVQLVTSTLNLPDANRIWVRNQQTKTLLISMGFDNIGVKRLLLKDD